MVSWLSKANSLDTSEKLNYQSNACSTHIQRVTCYSLEPAIVKFLLSVHKHFLRFLLKCKGTTRGGSVVLNKMKWLRNLIWNERLNLWMFFGDSAEWFFCILNRRICKPRLQVIRQLRLSLAEPDQNHVCVAKAATAETGESRDHQFHLLRPAKNVPRPRFLQPRCAARHSGHGQPHPDGVFLRENFATICGVLHLQVGRNLWT